MPTEILNSGPIIAAFDVATACGACDGRPGTQPRVWTWHLGDAGASRAYKLAYFRRLVDAYLAEALPDRLVYEKPLNIRIALKLGASDDQVSLLRGAIGVLESCAANAGVPFIEGISVQDARQHLTGQRTFPKARKGQPSLAKQAVMQRAAMLGVACENDNESDAFAIWSMDCARANPRLAHLNTPLFR